MLIKTRWKFSIFFSYSLALLSFFFFARTDPFIVVLKRLFGKRKTRLDIAFAVDKHEVLESESRNHPVVQFSF